MLLKRVGAANCWRTFPFQFFCVCITNPIRLGSGHWPVTVGSAGVAEKEILWRTASLRSAPHQQTPEPVYIVVDKLVHCDPNMYSQLCTEIYISLFLALA